MLLFVFSCQEKDKPTSIKEQLRSAVPIMEKEYQILKPRAKEKAVLILFGGYPESPEYVQREFDIQELALSHDVAIIWMNFNRRLWLEKNEKEQLSQIVQAAFRKYRLTSDNIYIGGFSSGGNASLLLSSYLMETDAKIQPKGVFIIDSPIDLLALYQSSERNIKKDFSEISVAESTMILEVLTQDLGDPKISISGFENKSPYTYASENMSNLEALNGLRIRLYTEPDTSWWMENRKSEYQDMNAFYIEKLSLQLQEAFGEDHVQLIQTEDKGYRANGSRHPHSWSIVDKKDLMDWMLN